MDLIRALDAAIYEITPTQYNNLATQWFGVSASLINSCGPLANVSSQIVAVRFVVKINQDRQLFR